MRQKWLASVQECQRLHSALDKAHAEIAGLERKLRHARRNLEEENHKRRDVEDHRDYLVTDTFFISKNTLTFFNLNYSYLYLFQKGQIDTARDLLFNDREKYLNHETREKLQFLNNTSLNRQSNTHIQDVPIEK